MAISDVKEYTHLTDEEVEQIGRELDAIRAEIEESRGASDAAYINRMIKIQRGLAAAGRVTLFASNKKPAVGARARACSALAKILENMEIGHNVMHGQWDWMNDPEIHSSNWEWDTAQPAEQWKHSHNYVHHQFTNVLGYDNDIGYGILRMAREQKWHPANLGQPVYNALLATLFQWGVALHDLDIERIRKGEKDPKEMKRQLQQIARKGRNQIIKDYVVYPALAGKNWKSTLTANATANLARNLWSYVIIFCGHFPDGALHFTEEEIEDETRSEWYLRQVLGAANFNGGPLLHILSRQPRLPDRAPPVPRPAEQPLRGDLRAGAGAVREVRPPLHHRAAAPAVRPGAAHDHQAVAAQPADQQRPARARPPQARAQAPDGRRAAVAAYRARRLVAQPRGGPRMIATMDTGTPFAWGDSLDDLVGKRVTQCALSRICGVCGEPLGRPIAFVGTPREVGRNAFHYPPHARRLRATRCWRPAPTRPSCGHDGRLRVRPGRPRGRRPAADVPAELAAQPVGLDELDRRRSGSSRPGDQSLRPG